jgi:hypothetical protein
VYVYNTVLHTTSTYPPHISAVFQFLVLVFEL